MRPAPPPTARPPTAPPVPPEKRGRHGLSNVVRSARQPPDILGQDSD